MNIAIILSGGKGSRLNKDIPKQFIEVFDKPIMAYTLEKFQNNSNIDAIEIIYNKKYFQETCDLVEKFNISKARWFVEGGNSYFMSNYNALDALKNKLSSEDIVVFHGCSSPMVTDEIINNSIENAKIHNACATVVNSEFSVWEKTGENFSNKSIHRSKIVQVQFPFTYKYGYIWDVYEKSFDEFGQNFDTLDLHDKHVVFNQGDPIYFTKGNKYNIKITTQEDLDLFKTVLKSRS